MSLVRLWPIIFLLSLVGCVLEAGQNTARETSGLTESAQQMDEAPDAGGPQLPNQVGWVTEVGSLDKVLQAEEPAGFREDGSGTFRTHCL